MKILHDDDGSFAFVFGAHEKELGIQLLLCIEPTNEDGEKAIQQAIREIKYAGVKLPDNVYPIH